MCGICGVISLTNQPLSASILQKLGRMNDALAHRGPDDSGVWHNETVALGHRRLAIIDLSAAGHQPMLSVDNQTVIPVNLTNADDVALEVTDLKGKIILMRKYHFDAGRHEIRLDTEGVLQNGIFIYYIRTSRGLASRVMIKR